MANLSKPKLLPKRRVFIKTGLQRSRRLLSIFSIKLRRVRLSVKYTWESEEESEQLIQYPNHDYRTGLKNLENYV